MLRRTAWNAVVTLPAAAATCFPRPHFSTPQHSFCSSTPEQDKDNNIDTGTGRKEERSKSIKFFGFLDKVKDLSPTSSTSPASSPPPSSVPSPSFPSVDDYTLRIMDDLKLSLDKHESKLREQAAQALAGHQQAVQTVLQTLRPGDSDGDSASASSDPCSSATSSSSSSYDLLDLIPASILDDRSKTSLRDLSRVCERITGDFHSTITHFDHPFLVHACSMYICVACQQLAALSHHLTSSLLALSGNVCRSTWACCGCTPSDSSRHTRAAVPVPIVLLVGGAGGDGPPLPD